MNDISFPSFALVDSNFLNYLIYVETLIYFMFVNVSLLGYNMHI
jgi:hypothetical protein